MKKRECISRFKHFVRNGAVLVERGPNNEPKFVCVLIGRPMADFPIDMKNPKRTYLKARYWAVHEVERRLKKQFSDSV